MMDCKSISNNYTLFFLIFLPLIKTNMDSKTVIEKLSQQLGSDTEEVKKLLAGLCEVVGRDCSENDSIAIPGFGTFETRKRMERISVHPATGKRMLIPPKIILTFKPSAVLKNLVRG